MCHKNGGSRNKILEYLQFSTNANGAFSCCCFGLFVCLQFWMEKKFHRFDRIHRVRLNLNHSRSNLNPGFDEGKVHETIMINWHDIYVHASHHVRTSTFIWFYGCWKSSSYGTFANTLVKIFSEICANAEKTDFLISLKMSFQFSFKNKLVLSPSSLSPLYKFDNWKFIRDIVKVNLIFSGFK